MGLSNHPFSKDDSRETLVTLGVLCVLDKSNIIFQNFEKIMKNHEVEKILISIEALNRGIIPSRDGKEIKQYLSRMTPEEQVLVKRKFRKLQRKYRRKFTDERDIDSYGRRGETPSSAHLRARKDLVFSQLLRELEGDA